MNCDCIGCAGGTLEGDCPECEYKKLREKEIHQVTLRGKCSE